jgi:hypothetical protein
LARVAAAKLRDNRALSLAVESQYCLCVAVQQVASGVPAVQHGQRA